MAQRFILNVSAFFSENVSAFYIERLCVFFSAFCIDLEWPYVLHLLRMALRLYILGMALRFTRTLKGSGFDILLWSIFLLTHVYFY